MYCCQYLINPVEFFSLFSFGVMCRMADEKRYHIYPRALNTSSSADVVWCVLFLFYFIYYIDKFYYYINNYIKIIITIIIIIIKIIIHNKSSSSM